MSFFEKNLEILRQHNAGLAQALLASPASPSIQVISAKSRDLIPLAEGRALHSVYNPVEEAARFVSAQALGEARAIVALGFGFAYHIEELLKKSRAPIIVVERRLDVLRAAMESRDLEQILPALTLLHSPAPSSIVTNKYVADALGAGACPIVTHDASARLDPEYYSAVKLRMQRGIRSDTAKRLKVLVVSPVFGGSWSVAHYCASGLKDVGCESVFLDMSPFHQALKYLDESLKNTTIQPRMSELFHRLLCEFTYWKIRQTEPDLVFFLAQAPVSTELLSKLREEKIQTAFWFVENHKLFPYWNEIAPLCDCFFTIQRGEFFSKLDVLNAFDHFYLPLCCEPSAHRPQELDAQDLARYGSDLSVAGFGYYNRLHMLQGLTDFSPKLWGPGWNRSSALAPFIQDSGADFDVETMVKIYNASSINLNLHSSTYATGVEPDGDFVNPRTFEIAGSGAFQLCDERSELGELFSIGSEIITFRNLQGLRELIRHYLDHPRERKEIANRSRQRALSDHTYRLRMRQMLECIYPADLLDRRTVRLDHPDQVSRLLAEMPAGHDLQPLLKTYQPDFHVTISGLIKDLAKAGGTPAPVEITLRWMENVLTQGLRR